MMKYARFAAAAVAVAMVPAFAQEAAEAEPAEVLQSPSAVSGEAYVEVASGYIDFDGYVISDSLVVQPGIDLSFDTGAELPIEVGFWANYATDKYAEMTQNHCFTEIDMSIGTSYAWEDSGIETGIKLVSWQYPNMAEWNGEELLDWSISKTVADVLDSGVDFKLGSSIYYMLTGDDDNNVVWLPFVEMGYKFSDAVSATLNTQFHYSLAEGSSGEDGFGSVCFYPTVAYNEFYVFAKYFVQLDDEVYSDEMNDIEDFLYGVGYAREF